MEEAVFDSLAVKLVPHLTACLLCKVAPSGE